jgi:dTDP-3-amino-2,3,6-trideoxy-4-keto-D-glucose/dTDP-3-amino-3,4,6-trideoxy-alpha-D-glucose/dTDP-2,6-dideoxy-D-kanosamine transaminase
VFNHFLPMEIGNFGLTGPELEAFESEFAAFCGVANCVGVASGTDALELALRALGVGPGDCVASVANAGLYATTAIRTVGAMPAYVDIDAANMLMDVQALRTALTPATKAVVVTHLYGRMADLPSILEVTEAAGIPIIEDCAQAHGAHIARKAAGSWGTLGCFSFYPTKNLGALGDAGAVITSSAELTGRLRELRQYGWTSKYRSVRLGRNSRMDEFQAAVLRVKLPHLTAWNSRRLEIAGAYGRGLTGLGLELPAISGGDYVGHLYVVRTAERDAIRAALTEAGIGSDIHYPVPDHKQPWVQTLLNGVSLPETERACDEVLSLPCFPELTDEEAAQVIGAVCRALAHA